MDTNKILKQASEAIDRAIREKQNAQEVIKNLGPAVVEFLRPSIEKIAVNVKTSQEDFLKALSKVIRVELPKIEIPTPNVSVAQPEITIPEIKIPEIKVPEPRVTVNVPKISVPDIVMPKEMDIKGWVNVMGYDRGLLSNPLPVQLRDADGRPVSLGGATSVLGGGGKSDYFTIKGFAQSAFAEILNPDGRVKVEMPAGSSGLTDAELRASSIPVEQVSGSIWSVSVVSSINTAVTILNADGTYRDTFPVEGSVAVSGVTGSIGATILNGEGLARDSWLVSDVTNSIKAALIDSSGVQYSGSNPVPVSDAGGALTVDGTVAVSGITNSVASSLIDSTGIQYSGSNPVPNTPYIVARTTNPTAVGDGNRVSQTADSLGRALSRPVQVRGLVQTAYVTEDEIQEVTLLAGVASTYHDLIYVLCANESTGAINLDFRQTTGGTVQMSVEVPANGTAGVSCAVPIPQDHADASWTVKNSASDNSNTVYSVTALFSKEV